MARPSREPQILAAALAVFAERGYDGTRVRDIAARAGVSEAALYSHHASKERLALELFRTHIGRYSAALEMIAEDRSRGVPDRIRAIAVRSLEVFAAEPDAFAFVVTHQSRFIDSLPAEFPFPIRVVEAVIAEGRVQGIVRDGADRLLAALVFGCIIQPVRTVLEAPPGSIDVGSAEAHALIADAAWAAIAAGAADP